MKDTKLPTINPIGKSGLQKTHPKSFIVSLYEDREKNKLIYVAPGFYRFKDDDDYTEVVVLQCLMIADSPKFYMVEIVKKSEYQG